MPRTNESIYTDTGRLGFIYVLTNAHMPGLVKVGATRKHPLQRANELGAGTGVPGAFELAYFRDFDDSFAAETAVHEHFAAARVNESREFFAASVGDVIAFINALAAREASQGVTGGTYQRVVELDPMPWSELFATFEDRGDGVLNETEQAACRALEARHD